MMSAVSQHLLEVLMPEKIAIVALYCLLERRSGIRRSRRFSRGTPSGRVGCVIRRLMRLGLGLLEWLVICIGFLAEGDRWVARWAKRTGRSRARASARREVL